jgi:hypothetical protein
VKSSQLLGGLKILRRNALKELPERFHLILRLAIGVLRDLNPGNFKDLGCNRYGDTNS